MRNPYFVDCDHNFCEKCLQIFTKCPIDNEKITNKILRKNFASKIQNLKITCPYDNEKCSWENKLIILEKHMKECNFKKIPCSNNCDELIYRKDLEKHKDEYCMNRPLNCPYCQKEILEVAP